ncbi:MAG: class D sortase [Anaerolineales bacterium]
MAAKKSPEELSVAELRRLLLDKRRVSRKERLERFRRTGRAIVLAPDAPVSGLEEMRSGLVLDTPDAAPQPEAKPSPRRRWMDRILLAVEMLAIIGLIGVLANGFNLLRTLNAEVVQAIAQPTMTATPVITAVVLPSGHTSPTSAGGARFNEEEIPEYLRPLVASLANVPVPTPSPEQAIRIQIPAIKVDAPIVQGDGWEQLKKGVGQHIGSANPGQVGNVVLSAHNDVFGEIFRDLDKLKVGDAIIIYTNQRQYTYIVSDSFIVEPTRVEVMYPTPDPVVTLISCYPYLINNQRIIIRANLQNP